MVKKAAQPATEVEIFTADGEQSLSSALDLFDLFETLYNGQYYELPFSITAHGRYFNRLLYIRSGLQLKNNMLCRGFIPHALFSREEFLKLALDYLWFGNAFLEKVVSRSGKVMGLRRSPAKYTRRDVDNRFKFIGRDSALGAQQEVFTFPQGSICHLQQPDINQEIYGVPDWLPAVISGQLNEAATKFRLRYYQNGSHAGYIIYATDANLSEESKNILKKRLEQSKGEGNFKNVFMYAPNGKVDGIKLIPLSEVTAKDEFFNIKGLSRDDQLAAVRVPPNILGIVPTNTSGFGSINEAAKVFYANEIRPLEEVFLAINAWLGMEVVRFEQEAEAE